MTRNRIGRGLGTFAVLVAAALGGCTNEVFNIPIGGEGEPEARVTAIDIQNGRGSVSVIVDPTVTVPTVEARPFGVKRSLSAEPADGEWVQATLDKQGAANVLRVRAIHPDGIASANKLHLVVTVSGTQSTMIRNNDGSVRVTGVSGSIDIQNGDVGIPGGDVQVRTDQPVRDSVMLKTSDGYVALSIPPKSAGTFTLEAPKGSPTFNSRGTAVAEAHSIAYDNAWTGVLNGGTNAVLLRSGDGDVRVNVIENPTRVSFQQSGSGQTAR